MFPSDTATGGHSDNPKISCSKPPLFPSASPAVRARTKTGAAPATGATPHAHGPIVIEDDIQDTDKYATHASASAETGTASVAVHTNAASVVPANSAHAHHPFLGSRRATVARTRRWAVRIVVAIVFLWFVLMQIVVLDDETQTSSHGPTTTMTTTTLPLPPRTGSPTQAAVTISPTIAPLNDDAAIITTSSSRAPTTHTVTPVRTSELTQKAAAEKQKRAAGNDEANDRVGLTTVSAEVASVPHREFSSSAQTDARQQMGEESKHPESKGVLPVQAALKAPAETFTELSAVLGNNAKDNAEMGTALANSPQPLPAGTQPARLPVRGGFTIVTVVATADDLVQHLSTDAAAASSSTRNGVDPDAAPLVAANHIPAHRFEYLARGLRRAGLIDNPRFFEWLVLRPSSVCNEVVAREAAAVHQWWREEGLAEHRATALLAQRNPDYVANLTPACLSALESVADGTRDEDEGRVSHFAAPRGAVRVAHSRRVKVSKPAALWLEAVASVQTSFIILHELNWGLRVPAYASVLAGSAPTVPPHLEAWYALRGASSSPLAPISDACPPMPQATPWTMWSAYVNHLVEVGVQVLGGEDVEEAAGAVRGAPTPGDRSDEAEPTVPPVVIPLGNFRDSPDRSAHVFRLRYVASPFDDVPVVRERALATSLQRFLDRASRGIANTSGITTEAHRTNGTTTPPTQAAVRAGLPTSLYGADQRAHCHNAPLYAVALPVPAYMRGGGPPSARSDNSDAAPLPKATSAHKTETTTLCDLIIDRKHHGYMANFTSDPLPFYNTYCSPWQVLTGEAQTRLLTQPALKNSKDQEEAAQAQARQAQMEKVQARLLKPNRLAEGICIYEWVRVLKAEQQKNSRARPAPVKPSHVQTTSAAPRRTAAAFSVVSAAAAGTEAATHATDQADHGSPGQGTPLVKYAQMLFSSDEALRMNLAQRFLWYAGPNLTRSLEDVTANVVSKLDAMSVLYGVSDGRRRNKRQQAGDLEVVCVPSRTAVLSTAPAMYSKAWLMTNMVAKCRKRTKDCVGPPTQDDARSMQSMEFFLSNAMEWSQGGFRVCLVPGMAVEDTAAGLLAQTDAEARRWFAADTSKRSASVKDDIDADQL